MPDLVPVDYDPFGGRDNQAQSYGGPDPAQRMRELEQPGRDALAPVSLIGEPAGAKDAADFAGQFGTTVALGTGIGQAARFAAPYVGRAASAGYQTLRDVMGDINGGMPLDKLGRINQLTGDRLAGETGGRSAGEPSRSFASIAEGDTPPAAGVEPIRAYHASPHEFPYFDSSKIGTGEGAQAYSHGLYFGGAKKTADFYYDQFKSTTMGDPTLELGGKPVSFDAHLVPSVDGTQFSGRERKAMTDIFNMYRGFEPQDLTPELIDETKKVLRERIATHESARKGGRSIINPVADMAYTDNNRAQLELLERPDFKISAGSPGKAHMYEADLHVHPDRLLDYDKPINQQTPQVLSALQERGLIRKPPAPEWSEVQGGHELRDASGFRYGHLEAAHGGFHASRGTQYIGWAPDLERAQQMINERVEQPGWPRSGRDLIDSLSQNHGGEAAASAQLRDAGIPGVKYLDQGSRNLQLIPPDQTVHGQWLVKQVPNGQVLYRGPDEAAARAAYNPSFNYVIYDDKLIDIVKKYGVAGLGLPAGAGALIPVDHQPQF